MKSQDQLESEQEDLLADLDGAYERAFRTADWVRQCPKCDGGWRVTDLYIDGVKMQKQATECSCFIEHEKSLRAVRIAKERYRKMNDKEPPAPDKQRLELW